VTTNRYEYIVTSNRYLDIISPLNQRDDLMTDNTLNIRHDLDPILVKKQVDKKVASYLDQMARQIVDMKDMHASYQYAVEQGTADKWGKARTDLPADIAEIKSRYENWIEDEQDRYSKVRVIELSDSTEAFITYGKRFVLVYGDIDDQAVTRGTGPTNTVEESAQWFFSGGR
jgi:hypothetical protein